jgi:hypothetical protein
MAGGGSIVRRAAGHVPIVLLYALIHAAASGGLLWRAAAAAAGRAATGAPPSRFDLLLLTVNGVLLFPLFNILHRFPATAGLFPGAWAAVPVACNSLLWGAALAWLFGRLRRQGDARFPRLDL